MKDTQRGRKKVEMEMTHVQAREHLEPLASTEKLVERRGLYFPLRASKGNQHFQRLAFGELWENECLFYVIQFVINYYSSSSIPGSGRSFGEGIGYPLQYSWASLVAQLVKKPSAMWETWIWSLDWEDPLEKGMATHSSILGWRIPWTKEVYKFGLPW